MSATNPPRRERFCDECGVVLELHPWPNEIDRGCHVAEQKARLLEAFAGVGR